jgi:hypothetical protein
MSEEKVPYRIEGRDKTIFRTVHDQNNPYVTINSTPITNPELSYKAKGILTYLMSRPDGWEVNVPDLVNHSTDGPASIRTGLNELRLAGHIHYNTMREGGYIKKWIIEVYEIPFKSEGKKEDKEVEKVLDSDFLQVGNQQVENLQVGNRGEVLSTLSNKELSSATTSKKKQRIEIPENSSIDCGQLEECSRKPISHNQDTQDGTLDSANLAHSLDESEITAETTSTQDSKDERKKRLKESIASKGGLDWLVRSDAPAEEIAALNEKIRFAKEATDKFEQELAFNPLPWAENAKWTRFQKFVVEEYRKDPACFRYFSSKRTNEGKYTRLPANPKIYGDPDLLIAIWPSLKEKSVSYGGDRTLPEQKPDMRKMITPKMIEEARHATRP